MIFKISSKSNLNFCLLIVISGVAAVNNISDAATPMVLVPKSNPIIGLKVASDSVKQKKSSYSLFKGFLSLVH
jgi:hypothetical protein